MIKPDALGFRAAPSHDETPPIEDGVSLGARAYLPASSLVTASRLILRSTTPSAASLTYSMGMTYSCLTRRPQGHLPDPIGSGEDLPTLADVLHCRMCHVGSPFDQYRRSLSGDLADHGVRSHRSQSRTHAHVAGDRYPRWHGLFMYPTLDDCSRTGLPVRLAGPATCGPKRAARARDCDIASRTAQANDVLRF